VIAAAATRTRTATVLPWLTTAVRLALGGVLLVAGSLKAIDLASSVAAVQAYALLPHGLEQLVGRTLPFVEIALGLLLVAGVATRLVALLTGLLLLVFVTAVLTAAARGLSIDCGCFGGGGLVAPGQVDYSAELVRDLVLVLLAGWLVLRPQGRLALAGPEGAW
jgi:uncharacterized membrane protein YphA (DoxX/SURF4 family)